MKLDEMTELNTSQESVKYQVGDLVWAKVSGHPWWPCMISTDASSNTHLKEVGTTKPRRTFYVEFFGPSVEHAWVAEGCLIEYKGIEEFKTYAQDQVDQAPTKSQKEKLAERFQLKVALSRRDQWEQAVDEADEALTKKRTDERLQVLHRKLSSDDKKSLTINSSALNASQAAVVANSNNDSDEENVTPAQRRSSRARTASQRHSLEPTHSSSTLASNSTPTLNNQKQSANQNVAVKRKRLSSVANSDDGSVSASPASTSLNAKISKPVNDNEVS